MKAPFDLISRVRAPRKLSCNDGVPHAAYNVDKVLIEYNKIHESCNL